MAAVEQAQSTSLLKLLTRIDRFLSPEHQDKLCFLAETVASFGSIEGADSIVKIQREIQNQQGISKKRSIVLLKQFLEVIGYVKFSNELDPIIDAIDERCSLLPPKKLYLYEICMMVCDELGRASFSQLKHRIPDEQLGVHRDKIKAPVQLFRRLLRQQTLSVDNEEQSLKLLCEWLDDIGRLDIVQGIKKRSRPTQEEGMSCMTVFPWLSSPPTIRQGFITVNSSNKEG